MARFKRKAPAARWFIAAAAVAVLGTLGGYAVGGFLAPRPVACEPLPSVMAVLRTQDGAVLFSAEKCEDGTLRMTPRKSVHSTPDMEPDHDGPSA